ncbi:MAG TPA: FISUMP domain-containing protein [Paludibacter sp.]|nr:FISUMP domain-containing protein [Paludibacter sp.]
MMKFFKSLFFVFAMLIIFTACNSKSDPQSLPVLTTTEAVSVTACTAITGGNITSNGGDDILTGGVCWSTTIEPTIADNKTTASTVSGTFTSTITGLKASTKYYVRAYATNSAGTSYGNEIQFTTLPPTVPGITTTSVSAVNQTNATGGGNITSDGGLVITSRGLCWSLKSAPTIADNKSSDGGGSGSFTSSITGLLYGKIYYVRAYAINSKGIAYGNEIKFYTSTETVTDVDGNLYHTVIIGNQTWMVENLKTTKYNDGTAIENITDNTAWVGLTSGAYCWHSNSSNKKDIYGGLYNWYAVNTGKLAPKGWHVPTYNEWKALVNYVQNDYGFSGSIGKALASGLDWASAKNWAGLSSSSLIGNDLGNNNYSGFSALPGSSRTSGTFGLNQLDANFWSSSTYSNTDSYAMWLVYSESGCNIGTSTQKDGLSVRCIKD